MSSMYAHATAHHLNKSDVELYVINALAMERAAEVESHVAECETCACALAHEAQLEMALEMVAERAAATAKVVAIDERREERARPHCEGNDGKRAPSVHAHARVQNARIARAGLGLASALAAAAALVLWIMPSTKSDPGEDVARYGAVSTDAAGAMVSFGHETKPAADTLDGG
jgi:hypothetical protein